MFIGVSERQETETNIRQLKEKKKNEKDLDKYRKWIQKSCMLQLNVYVGYNVTVVCVCSMQWTWIYQVRVEA